MVVIAGPIPTEKESHILKGLIVQLDKLVKENPIKYDKPRKILECELVNLIYEHGKKVLKSLYENIDDYPIVCIVLAGGMVKLGVIRNFFKEENRGNILKMIQEYKDFYIEEATISIIKKVEKETRESQFLLSRIKSREIQDVLEQDLRLLVYPLYATIDNCPYTCIAVIYELISKEKMKSIFNEEQFGNLPKMVQKYKEFYLGNRVRYLIERIAANPNVGSTKDSSIEKREAIEELIKIGEGALKPIYEIIDNYSLTCTQIIPLITQKLPYKFENFGVDINGKAKQNVQGMVADFKKWYNDEYLRSKQTV